MSFAVEGFKSISQNYVSPNIASNFYPRLPFLSALGAFTVTRNGKTNLNIGRPDANTLFTGKRLGQAEMMDLDGFNSYQVRIQGFETSNSKWMGARDTNPVVTNASTNAHSMVGQNAALFNRCRLKTPIIVWHTDKTRAGRSATLKGKQLGMAKILEEATETAFQEHVKEINAKIWTGSPASQASDPWDQPLGITSALSATNFYGNVDRSSTSNSTWRALVDGTFSTKSIRAIIDDANVTKGLNNLSKGGGGVDLLITTPSLYLTFKAEILAKGAHTVRVLADGIPGMGAMGIKQEVLQIDNAFLMYDSSCPANNVMGFVMDCWRFAAPANGLCYVEDFVDISRTSEGAKEVDQAFITSEFIFSCDNPGLQVRYTNIT